MFFIRLSVKSTKLLSDFLVWLDSQMKLNSSKAAESSNNPTRGLKIWIKFYFAEVYNFVSKEWK